MKKSLKTFLKDLGIIIFTAFLLIIGFLFLMFSPYIICEKESFHRSESDDTSVKVRIEARTCDADPGDELLLVVEKNLRKNSYPIGKFNFHTIPFVEWSGDTMKIYAPDHQNPNLPLNGKILGTKFELREGYYGIGPGSKTVKK